MTSVVRSPWQKDDDDEVELVLTDTVTLTSPVPVSCNQQTRMVQLPATANSQNIRLQMKCNSMLRVYLCAGLQVYNGVCALKKYATCISKFSKCRSYV